MTTTTTSGEQSIRNLLNEKLTVLSGVLRLGNEASQKGSLDAVSMHIVNNTRMLVQFDRSCLVDFRSGKPEVTSIMGMAEVNENSEYCVNIRNLLQPFGKLERSVVVREDALRSVNASDDAMKALDYFKGKVEDMIIIPLRPPDRVKYSDNDLFIWVVEFQGNMGTDTEKLLLLLSPLYSVALWYSLAQKYGFGIKGLLGGGRKKSFLTPRRIIAGLAVLLVLSLFIVRIDQRALGDFELEPPQKEIEYAPFSGILRQSNFMNGQRVKPGDVVIEYDTDEMEYELKSSSKEFDEISAELDMVRQSSFSKSEELGRVKMLEAKRDHKAVAIEKLKWYISKSQLKADNAGILAIDDPSKICGKSVNAGAELFQIMPYGKLIAKAYLNEADSSVICHGMKVTLYLHSMPARAIQTKILSVSPRPTIQENNQFCYVIRAELLSRDSSFLCGMRGVAKVSGRKVTLGYYLFRGVLLWWRQI